MLLFMTIGRALALAVLAAVLGFSLARADVPSLAAIAAQALGADAADVALGPQDGGSQDIMIDGVLVGYLGQTWDMAKTAGYSGRPINIAVVVDTNAALRGAFLLSQEEPVLTLGVKPEQIAAYINDFSGYDLRAPLTEAWGSKAAPDAIAGATISSGVIRSGIIRTARLLAQQHGLLAPAEDVQLDSGAVRPMTWPDLAASRALQTRVVTAAEADKALAVAGTAAPDSTFITLTAAVVDPPSIGANLLGEGEYSSVMAALGPGDHALFIGGEGLYSFKGTSWKRTGIFERIEIVQGERTIPLRKDFYRVVPEIAAREAPELRETAVFLLPVSSGFDPTTPFQIAVAASRDDAAGTPHLARFALDYTLPDAFLQRKPAAVATPASETPLWLSNWQEHQLAIGIVATMLGGLYLILIFQNQIAARPPLYRRLRMAYLALTVLVLGGWLSAQLSVVHVITFLQALRGTFSWETFLLDPVIFIIWGWVAVALLFWGRVYCGWLCPFGALQELLNKLAQRLGVRQITVPFMLHERLWPIKYIIFLGLFAASLASMTLAFRGAEVEPFKTAVIFRFVREWPFVLYVVALLVAGLFVERFYCRYLCPLGAALAIPARLRMFEWLKRRPQCGRECRICSIKCPVQAIHPEGHINPNECVYCLNCQTLYHNEHICPPLKARAARRASFNTPEQAS